MFTKTILLFGALAAIMAFSYADDAQKQSPIQLQGVGGGNLKDGLKGIGVHIDGRAPVWKSDNGRHQFDVTAGYTGPLRGSPYANKRVGGVYTYSFGR